MDDQESVLRSGHRPSQRRRRKGPTTPPEAEEGAQGGQKSPEDHASQNLAATAAAAAQFGCNVCLETARDPVVTHCGHLFCWPCLYRWVSLHSPLRDCPVCKTTVEIGPHCATVTPIYGADGTAGEGGRDPEVPPRPQGRRNSRSRAATVGEVLEEVRRRAEVLSRQAQMQTLDRTRAVIDRVGTHLQAVEGLVRDFSLRAARLRMGQMAVEVQRVSVTTVPEGTTVRDGGGAESIVGRTRRRGRGHSPPSGVDDEDGVYRGTRRRRRLAMEGESFEQVGRDEYLYTT